MYSLLSSSSCHHLLLSGSAWNNVSALYFIPLQTEHVPDLSQEPVAFLATAAIILPLASLEMLSFLLSSCQRFSFFRLSCCQQLPEFCL